MIFEINSVRVAPERAAEFEAAFVRARQLLLEVPGCQSARLLKCFEQPGRYQVQIGWDRIEDHRDHYPQTGQAVRVRALLLPLIESADMAHYEVLETGA